MNLLNEVIEIDKLKKPEDFQCWKFKITILLKANGLYGIVSGEEASPPQDHKDYNLFVQRDAKAQKLIILSIDKIPLTHVMTCNNSKEMFKKLKEMYERDSTQQKFDLMQEFFNFKFNNSVDISTNISILENLVFRLKALNNEINDSMVMSKILTSLDSKYRHFWSAWESTPNEEKTLSNLITRLANEEKRFSCSEDVAVAFKSEIKNKTNRSYSTPVKCFSCSKPGHISKFCSNRRQSKFCKICKKNNHDEKNCYFRKNKHPEKHDISFLANETSNSKWILDSGSSSHMTNDEIVLQGKRNSSGLYSVDLDIKERVEANFAENLNPRTWQRRLGHVSQECINKLSGMVDGLNLKNERSQFDCETCMQANLNKIISLEDEVKQLYVELRASKVKLLKKIEEASLMTNKYMKGKGELKTDVKPLENHILELNEEKRNLECKLKKIQSELQYNQVSEDKIQTDIITAPNGNSPVKDREITGKNRKERRKKLLQLLAEKEKSERNVEKKEKKLRLADETENMPLETYAKELEQLSETSDREVKEEEDTVGDEKHATTYQMLKNKGLLPKRKKEVRNPRVRYKNK
ncbi:uncharacterized protein [Rhodnius prolixus]|uniref:uncharacterized protein n=1 Tax=Rhodnius prolixus TaxID=13249 RepID=UPI003D18E5BC